MSICKKRQSALFEKIRSQNHHQSRLLDLSVRRKHGLNDEYVQQRKTLNTEMRRVRNELNTIRTVRNGKTNVNTREISMVTPFGVQPSTNYSSKGEKRWSIDASNYGPAENHGELLKASEGRANVITERGQKADSNNSVLVTDEGSKISNTIYGGDSINHSSLYHSSSIQRFDVDHNGGEGVHFVDEKELSFKRGPRKGENNDDKLGNYANQSYRSTAHFKERTSGGSKPHDISSIVEVGWEHFRDTIGKRLIRSSNLEPRQSGLSVAANDSIAAGYFTAMASSNNSRSHNPDDTGDPAPNPDQSQDAYKSNRGRRASKVTNVNDLLRAPRQDRERYNPDGSLRTVHKLPDFAKSYEQARKARYIRSREHLEREHELTTKEIFQKTAQK